MNTNTLFELHSPSGDRLQLYATIEWLENNGIPVAKSGREMRFFESKHQTHAVQRDRIYQSHSDEIVVYTAEGKRVAYMFGQYNYFWTVAERDEYKAEYHREYEALKARNRVKKQIIALLDEMDIDELQATLEKMGA